MLRTILARSLLTLVLLTLIALGPSHMDARGQPTACGSHVRRIEVNKTTLHYFECGQGEPLVFVHGAFGDLQTFREQVEAFATRFRVIVYSRRFFPPNALPRPTDLSPLGTHVADLRTLITDLKAGPAHLVGSSYGAYIALALAVDHPDLVRSLVLGEPPIWPLLSGTSVAESMRESLSRRAEATRKAFESGNLEDGFRRFVDAICPTPKCFDNLPEAQRTALVKEQAPAVRSEFMTEPSALMPPLECGKLGKLTRPTLLVTGERSAAMFLLVTAELERCLEGERQVMVPDAGHGMHGQNAAFYNQAVVAFLQRH
jgi:non-heme chloroperoxidase